MQSISRVFAASFMTATLLLPQATFAQGHGHDDRDQKHQSKHQPPPREWRNYNYNHHEPWQDNYDASRYYWGEDQHYTQRRLTNNDRIYRGTDDRYYCRHDDGTTGLIVGGIAGGVLGSLIAPGDSKTLGAIIGAGGGALVGKAIDGHNVSCR